jgi:hypothetical protein
MNTAAFSPTQLDLKLLHQNTATSSDPFATQTTNEVPDSAREKKRDEIKLTTSIYYLQH